MKKVKIKNKKKMIFRLLTLFIIFIILFFMLSNIKNKKNNNSSQIRLIINNEEYSNNLKKQIYVTSENTVYISIEDIKNIYDKDIFLDQENNQIITTYKTKIAVISLENSSIRINGTNVGEISSIIKDGENYYIPISDLTSVYNIEINVFKENKIVIIDSLDEELSKGGIAKNTSVKEKQKIFSKTLSKVKKEEPIVIIEKYDNGWTKVRTENGIIGYIKQKLIKDEKSIRQKLELSSISSNEDKKKIIEASNIKISQIENYDLREKYIEEVILEIVQNEYKTLCIDFKNIEKINEYLDRLIIEAKPRLLEYGKNLEIINNIQI